MLLFVVYNDQSIRWDRPNVFYGRIDPQPGKFTSRCYMLIWALGINLWNNSKRSPQQTRWLQYVSPFVCGNVDSKHSLRTFFLTKYSLDRLDLVHMVSLTYMLDHLNLISTALLYCHNYLWIDYELTFISQYKYFAPKVNDYSYIQGSPKVWYWVSRFLMHKWK